MTLEKKDWKSTLNYGLKLRSNGTGQLFLKGYGIIIEQCIDTDKPIYVDEEALIAFEDSLELTTISGSIKELLTSGEGFVYAIKGKGRLWLQTREKSDESSGGGLADGLFSFLK